MQGDGLRRRCALKGSGASVAAPPRRSPGAPVVLKKGAP